MNSALLRKPVLLSVLMIVAAGLAIAATPTKRMADAGTTVNLEKMIPVTFGEWRIDPTVVPVAVAPDVQAKLDKIYNQTLARTYVDSHGQRVMLSVAYGGDQSDSMQVHKPEVCYAAQGFNILKASLGLLATNFGTLPVKRLVANHGNRYEPITYWITIGSDVITSSFEQKLVQLKYGLTGRVPDGMLVRVSSIDRNEKEAYALQESFLRDILSAMEQTDRARVAGRFGA